MKTATVVLLLALAALALAHDKHDKYHGKDKDYKPKTDDHYRKRSSSSSSSSPEDRYRKHHRREYKRAAATLPIGSSTTMEPLPTTVQPLPTTVAPRQADAEIATTQQPQTTTAALKPAPTTASPRQADFEASSSTSTTEEPVTAQVIGQPVQTTQDCDFSCKFYTLINSDDGMPVNFNYRTSPTCLQVDAFCDQGFTLVTYGNNKAVPLDPQGHGIINCDQGSWFDMNGDNGSNVMCVQNSLVNKPTATEEQPVSPSDLVTDETPIEPAAPTTMLPATTTIAAAPFVAQTTTAASH
jgi:hypothetical protein